MVIQEATPNDYEEIVELYRNYGFALQEYKWFIWKYVSNPDGKAICFKILLNGRIVGTVALMPQRFSYRGRNLTGLQAVDGLLGTEIRGKGNFNTLMHFLTTQKPENSNQDYFYLSFPSLRASVKAHDNAGWKQLSKFFLATCILSPGPLIRNKNMSAALNLLEVPWTVYRRLIMGAPHDDIKIVNNSKNDPDFTQLVESEKISGNRSPSFIKWRVADNPIHRLVSLSVFDRNEWQGYAAVKIIGRTAEVLELRLKNFKRIYFSGIIRYIYTNHMCETIDFIFPETASAKISFNKFGLFRRSFSRSMYVYNIDKIDLPSDPTKWDISYLDSDW